MRSESLGSAWWSYLSQARWFGDKGLSGRIASRRTLVRYTRPGQWPAVTSDIVTVELSDGRHEHYHLVLGYHPRPWLGPTIADDEVDGVPVAVCDATVDPVCQRALVAAAFPPWADRPVRLWEGEQSNTSLVVGDDVLLKLYRRLAAGENRETDIMAALSERGSPVPKVLGTIHVEESTGVRTDLGIAMVRITPAVDGWDAAVAACREERDFSQPAHAIGQALRRVHNDLVLCFGRNQASGQLIAADMAERLKQLATQVPALSTALPRLLTIVHSLQDQNLLVQRLHGDFHLGQVILANDRVFIVDFEGEPAKSTSERDQPDVVWRDVAGLVRSLDYARHSHTNPDSMPALTWTEQATKAFLSGYCRDNTVTDDILNAYVADKAGYEVLYEVRHRPDWVHIPFTALTQLANRITHQPESTTKE